MVLPAVSLCISGFFLSVVDFFPVIHSWARVHQSSIFGVVDVLCAVSYTAATYERNFSLYCGFSCGPLCLSVQ